MIWDNGALLLKELSYINSDPNVLRLRHNKSTKLMFSSVKTTEVCIATLWVRTLHFIKTCVNTVIVLIAIVKPMSKNTDLFLSSSKYNSRRRRTKKQNLHF